jgi:hypothetical protein
MPWATVWRAILLGALIAVYAFIWLPLCLIGVNLLSAPEHPDAAQIAWDALVFAAPALWIGMLGWFLFSDESGWPRRKHNA